VHEISIAFLPGLLFLLGPHSDAVVNVCLIFVLVDSRALSLWDYPFPPFSVDCPDGKANWMNSSLIDSLSRV